MAPSSLQVSLILILLCGSPLSIAQTNFSGSAFNCPSQERSAVPPTSVHRLRPSDIAVIGAMGDSLSAGFGVLFNASNVRTDYRGLAFSAGGDASLPYVTTLPNILRQFNPDLYGFSTETTSSDDFLNEPNTRLNVARTGAEASDMLQQARDLVARVRQSNQVNFENDWKLVTVYIGGNDLCVLTCTSSTEANPDVWIQNVRNGLDYLQNNLPRTFVNLVQLLPAESATQVLVADPIRGPSCRFFYSTICPCLFGPNPAENFGTIEQQYRENLRNLVNSGRYSDSDNFTVVLQPFLTEIQFNIERDISSFAVDCVHLSPSGNRDFAIGLWNNMLEGIGEKSTALQLSVVTPIKCPTDDQPYLFTDQNSMSFGIQAQSPFPVILVVIQFLLLKIL